MSVEVTSSHLDGLAAARRSADQEIERAINSLRIAYKQVVEAAEHTAALTRGTKITGSMEELWEYLAQAREMLAEMTVALIDLHPKQAGDLGQNPRPESFAADVRNGLQSKRLAKWEIDALRERVVEALAGVEPKGTP